MKLCTRSTRPDRQWRDRCHLMGWKPSGTIQSLIRYSSLNRRRRIRWDRLCLIVLGVVGGDDCRSDVFLFPETLSASSIVGIEGSRPLGATRARLGNCVLNSELSLPPVSMLCEEFYCVPAAGAAACPANEKALSLLSSIPDVRPRHQARRLWWRPTADNLWAGNFWRLPVWSR